MTGWINVKTRPIPNGECLVWLNPIGVKNHDNPLWSIRKGSFWDGDFREWTREDLPYSNEKLSRISHWMPLPPPPESEEA